MAPSTETGSGFGGPLPGGQLLSAALGVTRAVTQFLGAALQVSIQPSNINNPPLKNNVLKPCFGAQSERSHEHESQHWKIIFVGIDQLNFVVHDISFVLMCFTSYIFYQPVSRKMLQQQHEIKLTHIILMRDMF